MSKIIKSIKVTDKGVSAKWTESYETGNDTPHNLDYDVTSNMSIHGDFRDALNKLRPVAQAVFGFKDPECINITGMSISGKDEEFVVITSKIKTGSGQFVGIATPRISLQDDPYGFGPEILDELVENVINETKLYLFEGKSSQLALQFSPEDEEFIDEITK
jgi:hypothetical protein